jgi:PIN domain nuclease of toxin-antitoxin system
MKAVLDTCTFLWLVNEPEKLSKQARAVIANFENELYLSVVSGWEIAVKCGKKQLELSDDPTRFVPRMREKHKIRVLNLEEDAALQVTKLQGHHSDPFDRMLISQALHHGLTIITPDKVLSKYPVKVFW